MEYRILPVCRLRWLHQQQLRLPHASVVVIKSKWTLTKVLWNTIWSCFCRSLLETLSTQFSESNFFFFFFGIFHFITSLVHFSWLSVLVDSLFYSSSSPLSFFLFCVRYICNFVASWILYGPWAFSLENLIMITFFFISQYSSTFISCIWVTEWNSIKVLVHIVQLAVMRAPESQNQSKNEKKKIVINLIKNFQLIFFSSLNYFLFSYREHFFLKTDL